VMAAFWPRHLEPILLAPENEGLRWQAAQVGATAGRRFAHALIVRADPQRGTALHRLALSDRDPSVARAGLASAIATVEADTRRPLLQLALRHPSATVRAEALRALGGEGLDDARGLLEGVLFDRAQAPRAAAAFLLRQLHGFDARRVWRAALDDRDARATIALLALAAVAEAQDAPRLRAWGDAPSARVRIAVLRGLLRSGATDAAADLRAALRDVSPRVVREALQLAADGAMTLDRRTFEEAYADAAGGDCRVVLIRGVQHLDLWDALLLLLRWSRDAPDALRGALALSIRG
jgi:hypothetical protein